MSDGWTGLNIEAVKKELDDFEQKMTEISTMMDDAWTLFSDELHRMWASPKAVEFNKQLHKLDYYEYKITLDRDDILLSASNAAKVMAQHNGATFDYEYHGYHTNGELDAMGYHSTCVACAGNPFPWELQESRNGVQGMNIPMVKYSLNCFRDSANNVVSMLNELPMNFSLIDPEGELVAIYRSIVSKTASDLQEAINTAVATVSAALEEETLQVRLGKEQAEQTLSA